MAHDYPESLELLSERMTLAGAVTPVLAHKYNGDITPLDDERLLGAADMLRFPATPSHKYMHTMLHLFPGEEGETALQAHDRIREVADSVVEGLSKLASGETLDADTIEMIDDTLTRARTYFREDECQGLGKVTIQYAVN